MRGRKKNSKIYSFLREREREREREEKREREREEMRDRRDEREKKKSNIYSFLFHNKIYHIKVLIKNLIVTVDNCR